MNRSRYKVIIKTHRIKTNKTKNVCHKITPGIINMTFCFMAYILEKMGLCTPCCAWGPFKHNSV